MLLARSPATSRASCCKTSQQTALGRRASFAIEADVRDRVLSARSGSSVSAPRADIRSGITANELCHSRSHMWRAMVVGSVAMWQMREGAGSRINAARGLIRIENRQPKPWRIAAGASSVEGLQLAADCEIDSPQVMDQRGSR